jgi:hypothetical protein
VRFIINLDGKNGGGEETDTDGGGGDGYLPQVANTLVGICQNGTSNN